MPLHKLNKPEINRTPRTSITEQLYGSKYPYFDYDETFCSGITNKILRGIAGINPFAMKQVSDDKSVGFGPLRGNYFFRYEPYPNSIAFGRWMPGHFTPLETSFKDTLVQPLSGSNATPAHQTNLGFRETILPRGCKRLISAFDRCKMVNGSEKCGTEVQNVMEQCPTWALEKHREGKRFWKKVHAIQNKEYQEAMKVSSYNEGRTVADISDKTWVHGTKKYLRPDSMWADDRYINVTLEEIEEAKVRYNARKAKKAHHADHHDSHHGHDNDYAYKPVTGVAY